MKRFLIALLIVLLPVFGFAGEIVTTPSDIVISEPTTNQVEKLRMTFYYNRAGNHLVVIWYNVMNQAGTEIVRTESVRIQNRPDDPDTPEDESTTDFTDFINGFGATLKSRGDTQIWQDIQNKYITQ